MTKGWLLRYGRRRRLVAAALAALAVLSAYAATRPTPPATVLVAAHDLPAGPLTAADLTSVPLNHPPTGVIRHLTPGTTHHLTSPMRRGEPLTDARLLKTAYTRLPPGMVATPVRVNDPDAAALLSPGSTVNVLATWPQATAHTPARAIAEAVTVITIPPPRKERDLTSTTPRGTLLLLATTTTQAAELAAAQATAHLSITMPPPAI